MSRLGLVILLASSLAACRRDMFDQPKFRPLAKGDFFSDGRSARPVPAGTFAFGEADESGAVETGLSDGAFVPQIPIPIDEALLRRGQDRFDIFCSPCHSRVGDGHGMVSKRGFIQPADLHSARVRNAPPGYIFGVIANGYGAMPEYSVQLPPRDRWAVVAYIRALELSRGATLTDVPPDARGRLENTR